MIYAKLAVRNAMRSAKDYLIYLVTMSLCVTLFYGFLSITSKYYKPDIGVEFDLAFTSSTMKMAVCGISLLLLFLIYYVNNYMFSQKQKEFAIQAVMGMEKKIIARVFLAETVLMGTISVVVGVFLGNICSQFVTGILLTTYGQQYHFVWTLYPDTLLITLGFFTVSLLFVGLINVIRIRRVKIIDMLNSSRLNGVHMMKTWYMLVVVFAYSVFSFYACLIARSQEKQYLEASAVIPVKILFKGTVIATFLCAVIGMMGIIFIKRVNQKRLISCMSVCALLNIVFTAFNPIVRRKYDVSMPSGATSAYFIFLNVHIIFLIFGIVFIASTLVYKWKERSAEYKYKDCNLFFFGQLINRLDKNTKTMSLIAGTLMISLLIMIELPVVMGSVEGFQKMKSVFDIQMGTTDYPEDDYDFVTSFLEEKGVKVRDDKTCYVYNVDDRNMTSLSLTDYNNIRKMLGYSEVKLADNEFAVHFHMEKNENERERFLNENKQLLIGDVALTLANDAVYDESISEYMYLKEYVILILPDEVCKHLIPYEKTRHIMLDDKLAYNDAIEIEEMFYGLYNGKGYFRSRTQQLNEGKGGTFVMKTSLTYSAVVLIVICFTILSLQQITDIEQQKQRFIILRKLGVDDHDISILIVKTILVWFGAPVCMAAALGLIVIAYSTEMLRDEITAYVGVGAVVMQVVATLVILIAFLLCYVITTVRIIKNKIK